MKKHNLEIDKSVSYMGGYYSRIQIRGSIWKNGVGKYTVVCTLIVHQEQFRIIYTKVF